MQQNEIVVFAPSMDLMQLLKELQDESSFPFTLQFGLYDGAIAQARQAMEDGANVLVSRGETTLLIRKELQEIPVVDIDIPDSDTLEILMQARDFGGPIAILGYGPFLRGARRIMPFLKLDVPYEIFQLTNVAEVEGIMRDIIRRGFRVAVGNPFAVKIGISMGLPGFFSQTTREQALIALTEAYNINRLITSRNAGPAARGTSGSRNAAAAPGDEAPRKRPPQKSKPARNSGFIAYASFSDVIHESPLMRRFMQTARQVAALDEPVLITGETGTGKNLLAQCIHNASPRSGGPFLWLNCAALPEQLVESELFGYQGGAFSGASKSGKQGFFDLAMGGTLLLDEVGELPLAVQSKLLQVLDEHRFIRVGGDRLIQADIRIVAATNRSPDPQALSRAGLRQDLFHRLSVFHLHIPPLRERREDIIPLLSVFMRQAAQRFNRPVPPLPGEFILAVERHDFPGNVRELRNMAARIIGGGLEGVMHRLVSKSGEAPDGPDEGPAWAQVPLRSKPVAGRRMSWLAWTGEKRPGEPHPAPPENGIAESALTARHARNPDSLQTDADAPPAVIPPVNAPLASLRELEWQHIRQALADCGGNKAKAARALGISTTTLWRRCKTAGWL